MEPWALYFCGKRTTNGVISPGLPSMCECMDGRVENMMKSVPGVQGRADLATRELVGHLEVRDGTGDLAMGGGCGSR